MGQNRNSICKLQVAERQFLKANLTLITNGQSAWIESYFMV